MDAYEATRVVFARLQSLDPENAHKVMGFLLLQESGEEDVIRLAFGPETHLLALVGKAREELGLAAAVSQAPFLLRQNSTSRLLSPSWHALPAGAADELVSAKNVSEPPFYGAGDLADEFHFADRSASRNGDPAGFHYGLGWGVNGFHHRRSAYAAADFHLGETPGGLGWEPCLYFARGYCKNGAACRFLHGLPEDAAPTVITKMDAAAAAEQQCQELLLKSKSQRVAGASQLLASAIPYSPAGSEPPSPLSPPTKSLNFLLRQQQNETQRAAATAAAALMLNRSRSDVIANPSSRQIYLTFPADSIFSEDDVSNYFSIYGPVQDVRIPYQQKRMFGFVTFLYAETVKLILAKGNPHFVCDSRVLVKPYKEKGKVAADKFRKQQLTEWGDLYGCTTPPSMDLGLYDGSCRELSLRRKLEEQQQAAELQRAIELQRRRFMGLQLLDLKKRSLSSAAIASAHSPTSTATQPANPVDVSCTTTTTTTTSSSDESPTEDKSKSNCSHLSLKEDGDAQPR
ncbi:zinc finger CCCH domain-containing protein 53-like isoform X2 [Curcuma longa]|uniref:zinc finger CCCH domain-containing protein 53-like isoform X2 n=1 Tax=Curcuma longa TaxID=136217 RepID=UPI003D9E28CE